ncbi:MAG: ribonuclease PH [Candidatus Hydrogenedentes bacterium]|nr:ribonuclease PH [Candidatus Hydrogenedentota bacterium]
MRTDGRASDALRPVSFERNFTRHAAGSVLVSFGDTKVICTASLEKRVPPWLRDSGKGWVTAEYAMLPGSTHDRIRRDANKKGRALEISRLIGRSLRAMVDLEKMGEQMITLDCDVIQADGGTRTAAISGAYVALQDAVSKLLAGGVLTESPLTGYCAAVSVGVIGDEVLLDLCYEEDVVADVDMNIVMDDSGDFIEVQGCAEGRAFNRAQMDAMLAYAGSGIGQIIDAQKDALVHG